MILADHSSGQPIFVFIALLFALIKFLAERAKKAGATTAPKPSADSEEERTKRFLEALGQPPAGHAPPSRRPDSMRQKMPTTASTRERELPSPPITPPSMRPQRQRKEPPRLPVQPPEPYRIPPLPVLPDLVTPAVPEFQTRTSTVSAIAWQKPDLDEPRAAKEAAPADLMRDLLRTSGSLRTAFLLREVLGPPRGLPGSDTGPTLSAS